jgi:ferrous iron transport protein B
MAEYTIALAGNPNTGKTTNFNQLTGSNQHTGNWPGKTVARKEGIWRQGEDVFHIVDLPGAYSLSAFSAEEIIARDFIVENQPDAVIVVVDATNLERNLYLALQILEMTPHVVLALNMMDAARAQGLRIDLDALSQRLGVPVIPMTARTGQGMAELEQAMVQVARTGHAAKQAPATPPMRYNQRIEEALTQLAETIARHPVLGKRYRARWLALKLLQGDEPCIQKIANVPETESILTQARQQAQHALAGTSDDLDTHIAEERYTWLNRLVNDVVQGRPQGPTRSDRVDAVITHPVAGLFIFFAVMWMVFKLSTDVAAPLVDWIDSFVNDYFAHWVHQLLALGHLQESWFASLVVDGLLAGLGGILVFVPVLMFLYMGMALMEDSGYMARAAFVMDRYMRKLGLQGKSFVPLVLGFGCNVPAIYATRTLESHTDRILTGLLVPFMSCSARLPVYVLIATIFFPQNSTLVVLAMYLLGILMALIAGLMLRKTLFKRAEESAMLIEVPSYRMPTLHNVWTEMWLRTGAFLRGAGAIIMVVSMVIWLLMAIPVSGDGRFAHTPVDDSAFAHLAGGMSPAFEPLGFGNWQNSSALITGFLAKEVVVSTLAQVYHVAPEPDAQRQATSFWAQSQALVLDLGQAIWDTVRTLPSLVGIQLLSDEEESEPEALALAIRQRFEQSSHGHGALAALAFMIYVLIYSPCVATIAAQRQEFGFRWMFFSLGLQLATGWLLAFVVFQVGKVLLA